MSAWGKKDLNFHKNRAAQAMIKGAWRDALDHLLAAGELAPRDTHVALKVGDMHQRLGNTTEAIAAYKRAAALFAEAGFLLKAISVNKIVLSLDPRDTSVQTALAALYAIQHGPAAAEPPAGSEARATTEPEEEPVEPEPVFEIDLARVDPDRLPYTPLLSDLTRDELNSFIGKLVVTSAAAGTLICREGDPAESMFVIVHGLVRVTSRDANGNPLWLTNLADGSFFGEFGLLGDGRRHADVEVVQDSELLQIERSRLDELIATHPRVEKVLFDFYKARVIDTLLAKNPVFRSLSADERRNLLDMAALEIHEAGSMVIQEGDDGQHLFVIKSGRVQVSTSMADKPIALATLKPGDIFGEISLLTGAPATADVVALERTELVKFSKREITWLAERHSQLRHLLGEVVEHRIHDSIEQIQTEGFV